MSGRRIFLRFDTDTDPCIQLRQDLFEEKKCNKLRDEAGRFLNTEVSGVLQRSMVILSAKVVGLIPAETCHKQMEPVRYLGHTAGKLKSIRGRCAKHVRGVYVCVCVCETDWY